jgi:hypothetical protein
MDFPGRPLCNIVDGGKRRQFASEFIKSARRAGSIGGNARLLADTPRQGGGDDGDCQENDKRKQFARMIGDFSVIAAYRPAARALARRRVAAASKSHRALHRLAIETFFCDRYAPWQKGGVENAIARMRRFISAQDRPRNAVRPTLQRPRSCLQQHPQKMS